MKIAGLVLGGYLLLSAFSLAQVKPAAKPAATKTATPAKCVAGLNQLCASDKFYVEYKRYKDYQAKYGPPEDVQLIMKGLLADLNEEIQAEQKAGYVWNDKESVFIKPSPPEAAKPATPPAAPTPVSPAPEPKK